MAKLAVCVAALVLLVALVESSRPACCTSYYEKPVPVEILKYYKIQEDTGHCNIKAVIFKLKMRNSKPLCANPDRRWVQRAMTVVPEKL